MGLQLIFVVETNSKSKSDWIYIKDTVERFYQYDQYHVKFTPVYMDGKGKYQGKKKEVNRLISQYSSTSKTNQSKVIYCFDCDDYDVKREDSEFLKEAEKYCNTNGYDFIWFCKDIECVYLGKKIERHDKQRQAANFKAKKQINKIDPKKLQYKAYQKNTSNILNILDQHLERREIVSK